MFAKGFFAEAAADGKEFVGKLFDAVGVAPGGEVFVGGVPGVAQDLLGWVFNEPGRKMTVPTVRAVGGVVTMVAPIVSAGMRLVGTVHNDYKGCR